MGARDVAFLVYHSRCFDLFLHKDKKHILWQKIISRQESSRGRERR